jgi:CDP-4-dehydro-6-deoxyglucose reductase, E1
LNKDSVSKIIKIIEEDYNEENNLFIEGISRIKVSGKVIDKEELINGVKSVLNSNFTSDYYVERFEKSISSFLGIRHTLFVNSGSSANLIALSALKKYYEVPDFSEVITCAVGFPTTVNPIIQNNLVPVFIDVNIDTLNIDVNKIESSITSKTKGIVIAHTLGIPFELEEILNLAKKYNLFVLEDNCDALGSKYKNQLTGTFGDVSTLSFYPAHHITTGEGGAVCTNNPKIKKLLESFRDWGRDCYCPPGEDNTCKKRFEWQLGNLPYGYDHKYIYSNVGYNLKGTEMQAALGCAQINKLEKFISSRIRNYEYLYKYFSKIEYFKLPIIKDYIEPSWFGFPITLDSSAPFSRNELVNFLNENLIDTRFMFGGNLVSQPAYVDTKLIIPSILKNAEFVLENSFWIGLFPGLNKEMLNYVTKKFDEFLSNY